MAGISGRDATLFSPSLRRAGRVGRSLGKQGGGKWGAWGRILASRLAGESGSRLRAVQAYEGWRFRRSLGLALWARRPRSNRSTRCPWTDQLRRGLISRGSGPLFTHSIPPPRVHHRTPSNADALIPERMENSDLQATSSRNRHVGSDKCPSSWRQRNYLLTLCPLLHPPPGQSLP